jgi:hypothetical protein
MKISHISNNSISDVLEGAFVDPNISKRIPLYVDLCKLDTKSWNLGKGSLLEVT